MSGRRARRPGPSETGVLMRIGNFSTRLASVVALGLVLLASPVAADECQGNEYSSTFELIQDAVFARHGCTDAVCHGVAQQGGLDLRPDVAYDNLVDVDAQTVEGMKRLVPGRKEVSLLWINLAAKTLPDEWTAPLRAMPLDPLPGLSPNELEAVRLWIESGAPREGVVEGTGELLDACLPPPEPIAIKPLPPPPPGTGVQLHMPRWILPPQSEREVCFATYYDVTDQVPPEFRGPDGTTFRYRRNEVRQDALSHHLIVNLYTGQAGPNDPAWGPFRCRGGAKDGEPCDPTDLGFCGEGSGCAADPVDGVACIGYGPGDAGLGLNSAGISGTQESASSFEFFPGVFSELPLKGIILWNSHAFNLTDQPGKLEAWLNFEFAAPEEQQSQARQIFDTSQIFKMNAPAFSTDEPCNIYELPRDAHLYELSSHMHKRGKRFRIFEGAWRCDGGPNAGEPCEPLGYDFDSRDVCAGAQCRSVTRPRSGDCDFNGEVSINELIAAVGIATGTRQVDACVEADIDGNGSVQINELVTAVNAALNGVPAPVQRDPEESMLYVSFIYNDPVVLRFDQPKVFPRPDADERALTYCAFYDNGYTDPSEVKRRSTSPEPPVEFPGIGGPCSRPTHCAEGRVGEPCSGRTDAERDASCDTEPGAGDGMCDACPLRGGVTTEDEMFILLGQYFIPGVQGGPLY